MLSSGQCQQEEGIVLEMCRPEWSEGPRTSFRFVPNFNELMLPLQGEAWTLQGGDLVGQDRGNYGTEDVGRQRGEVIFQLKIKNPLTLVMPNLIRGKLLSDNGPYLCVLPGIMDAVRG